MKWEDPADSGLLDGLFSVFTSLVRRVVRSCGFLPGESRFVKLRSSRLNLLREVEREKADIGDAGGGIATALGSRPRGVGWPRDDGSDGPIPEIRPLSPGFGVEKGEPGGREGEESVLEIGEGEEGKLEPCSPNCLIGLATCSFLELSCLAVILAYLAALDPGVSLSGSFLMSPFCAMVDLER